MIVDLQQAQALSGQLKEWAYNALDCTGTLEVFNVLKSRLEPRTYRTYGWERALLKPALAMQRRGIRVDMQAKAKSLTALNQSLKRMVKSMSSLPVVADNWDGTELETGKCPQATRKDGRHKWPKGVPDSERKCEDCNTHRIKPAPFNALSHHQARRLLYDILQCKPQRNKTKQISVDDDCLERIGKLHPHVKPITDAIAEIRNVAKQIGFLNAKLSPTNRWMQSVNVGAAWTGRFSSSKSAFGEGGNTQNIAPLHRNIFIPDAGFTLCYADLEQAESNTVAHLAGDEEYIAAHKAGDVHTYVTRLVWPELLWTGDLKMDKAIAKQSPPWDQAPGHDYRFQAKRIQHGSNYGLSAQGIAMLAKIPKREAERAQSMYFTAFPMIRAWQESQRGKVMNSEPLVNPLGRKASLFGRPWDEHTYKQGLAFEPQSMVADVLNLGLYQIWQHYDPDLIQLLAQVHDAVLCQFKTESTIEAVEKLRAAMTIPVEITGADGINRMLTIGVEVMTGRNWGYKSETNPHGMEVYK